MDYTFLRVGFAVIGVGVLSYFDVFNNKNIPEHLLYLFLILSFILFALSPPEEPLISSLSILLVFAIGFFAYRAGHIGGADVLALTSLSLLLPENPHIFSSSSEYFSILPFIVPVLYYSVILFSAYNLVANLPKSIMAILEGKVKINTLKTVWAFFLLAAFAIFLYFSFGRFLTTYLLSITIMFISAVFLALFGDFLRASSVTYLPAKKIEQEDVLALEFMDKELIKKYNLRRLVGKKELAQLRKLPIKKFAVYTGMVPFLPFLFFGLIFALLFGDAFLIPFA
ncbi:MAG: hypothetical protein QXN01_00120 [Candidatus Anstonellales archaeon]